MICLDTSIAQFFTFEFWSLRTNIAMMIMALIALTFTIVQVLISRNESRRATAYSAYQEYLNLCFENHKFAYGNESEIKQNDHVDSQYPWFVSQMLFTFEQVLETDKKDKEWEVAIESQLRRHKWYLKESNSVSRNEWNSSLRSILNKIIGE
ncbi:membrane protein [Aliivibrio wodanis]|uniref:Membrane protein n=1 Tax=Aliivibrio wodanis TaxID=80852 RepID=A0A090I5Q8_9GAMM|nr:membrane protein [Aliivibrio wodanis]